MKTFTILSLGCKVNQYESQQMRQLLQDFGLTQVGLKEGPDIAIVHTCCVTHTAASKSRQLIRKIIKNNPDCKIIATGCLPGAKTGETDNLPQQVILVKRDQSITDTIKGILPKVDFCLDSPNNPDNRISDISKTANRSKIKDKNELSCKEDILGLKSLNSYTGQSRAFLKIQDGCDSFCTYCIIPKVRNKIWSNSFDNIIKEAESLVDSGHKEIVLTGIFLGAYGQTTTKRKNWDGKRQKEFTKLVDRIAKVPGLQRLRLSSLEPGDVTDELLDVFNSNDNIAPHLHLPLQAGSAKILRRMNRQYNAEQFHAMIERVYSKLDRPAITTDIIVGFPGESDLDFEETLKMSRFAEFAKIHVFSFSLRKGTVAEKMDGHLPPNVIKERASILSQLDNELQEKFRMQFGGEKISVIVENEKHQAGRCGRYFEVKLNGPKLKRGQFTYATLNPNCIDADIIQH